MFPAPLSFLRGRGPTRTILSSQNPIRLWDTAQRSAYLEFYHDSGAFFNKQTFPSHDSSLHTETTIYHPPAHYHLLSDEHFAVLAGGGTWHLWDKTIHLAKGDEIVVPARCWHRFEGDPSVDEPLVVAVKYDPGYAAMEERFFRNTLGYLADCHAQGVSPSVFQLMVFFMHNAMPPGIHTPGPERLNLLFNTIFMFVVGAIGQVLLGYRASYPEYYKGSEKNN